MKMAYETPSVEVVRFSVLENLAGNPNTDSGVASWVDPDDIA